MPADPATRLTCLAAAAVCAMLSLAALRLVARPAARQPDRPPGCSILALPAALAVAADPLRGWEALATPTGQPPPAPPDQAAAPETVPGGRDVACRIQFHGTAGEGPERVYFFFDTEADRWFSLMPGRADAEARVQLGAGADGAEPRLTDLASGLHFLIRPGEVRLVPET